MSIRMAALAALVAAPANAAAPEPAPLTLQQGAALKCSAAFALGAAAQQRGEGKQWPDLSVRGREFFVRTSARVMDETGWSRDLVSLRLVQEANALSQPATLALAMPPCLSLLAASGL